MKGIFTQCRFEVIRIFRNPYYVFWSLMMPIVFYFIYTNVFNTELPNPDEWQAYFLMSMATFSVMGSAVMNFGIRMVQEHTQGWAKFMKITPFPSWGYFSAKMFGQMVMHALSIIVIFLAGSIINGITLTAGQWIAAGAWILIASIPFLALGSLIGTMKKVETASGVSNILYLGLAVLGGMWMPMEVFPPLLQNIGEWLPSYHFGSGAWEIVLGNPPELLSYLMLIGYMVVFMYLAVFIRRKQQA
ncbi:ABC transporter permease [Lentibacillus sediminis]|uniref:ABC transporter permease n=1 Tax=Lentibacillus sediminis TaxID=1940529 RepID=UPI000C1C6E94|nr:ABC transporter permease [Lentibacillus sediminis]